MLSSEQRAALRALPVKSGGVRLMEVCGTHTMAIARAGLRRLLPEGVELLSGPGCPVCVTHPGAIDAFLKLAMEPGVTLATYGDMLRVPGSVPGDTLARRRAQGARVEVVYSPMDALSYAQKHPQEEVVFLGVGFETTAPGTAAAILSAQGGDVRNFSVFSLLKRVEPALRALCAAPDVRLDGFLCPGHVATILGAEAFAFLPRELGKSAVVGGFETEDVLRAVYALLRQCAAGEARLENEYRRGVSAQGNRAAQTILEKVFCVRDARWRGLGELRGSGYALRAEYAPWDAQKRFDLSPAPSAGENGCRCGEVMRGVLHPWQCPLFGGACTPEDAVGPCMVSSEGACAAAYKYRDFPEE